MTKLVQSLCDGNLHFTRDCVAIMLQLRSAAISIPIAMAIAMAMTMAMAMAMATSWNRFTILVVYLPVYQSQFLLLLLVYCCVVDL
jgi:hypothetical protein